MAVREIIRIASSCLDTVYIQLRFTAALQRPWYLFMRFFSRFQKFIWKKLSLGYFCFFVLHFFLCHLPKFHLLQKKVVLSYLSQPWDFPNLAKIERVYIFLILTVWKLPGPR